MFKVGDLVHIVSDDEFMNKERGFAYGYCFIIQTVQLHPYGYYLYNFAGSHIPFTEDELVHSSVWHSPLYKAMKEEDV